MATTRRRRLRLLATLTLLGLLLPALARPWLAPGPAPEPAGWGPVCTAQGLAGTADAPGQPAPSHAAWAHCPWCLLPLDLGLPPPERLRPEAWPRVDAGRPVLPRLLPPPQPAATALPLPRGPPPAAA
jgi:hypothetical protein